MNNPITATADELIGISAANTDNNLRNGEIEAAISANEIPHFNTPRGKMIRKSDAALVKLRNSSVNPL